MPFDNPNPPTKEAQVIDRVLATLEERGWYQGWLTSCITGAVCLVGAINLVDHGDINIYRSIGGRSDFADVATARVFARIAAKTAKIGIKDGHPYEFNDDPGTSFNSVKALLNEVRDEFLMP